jgi:hypothetical protein
VVGEAPLKNALTATCFEVSGDRKQPAMDRPATPRVAPAVEPNGFSLIPEAFAMTGPPTCRFRVLRAGGSQRMITVCFDDVLVAAIDRQRRVGLWIASRFWSVCAQIVLAAYLTDVGDYPPGDRLMVGDLDEEEMLLAVHWRD